jgi:hypothetical protein
LISIADVEGIKGPIPLGGVRVDPDGHLARRSEGKPLAFTFSFRGVLFAGQAESTFEKSRLRIYADLGALPYTAEARDRRWNAVAIVNSASRALGGRVRLSSQQHILLMEEKGFNAPLAPRDLVAHTVRLILEVKPYLDLLSLVVEPPGAKRHLSPGRP